MNYDQYETVIGLETHVQLSTHSKVFCADDARYGGAPNTHISPISLGHPGTLPRLNQKVLDYAVRLGLALGSHINQRTTFDRKNYFYADLPKGYQLTQDVAPICMGGQLNITVDGQTKPIRIHHIHIEEDAGKSIHAEGQPYSQIDLNRAGVPLLEIVSEPDLRSGEEVDAFMSAMRQLVRYLDISDGNMEQGSMRCDCNVSVRLNGSTALGTRCEIKNMNSMRYARRAIAYEHKRQVDLLGAGQSITQQTLQFDPATGSTSPLRSKEDAHDYRYFPAPDLPPVVLTDAYVEAAHQAMPALPWQLHQRLTSTYQLSDYDANILCEERETAEYFLALVQHTDLYKPAANLLINKVLPHCSQAGTRIADFPVPVSSLVAFLQLIAEDKVSNSVAYQRLFPALLAAPNSQPLTLAESLQLLQTSDTDALSGWIEQVLAANPEPLARYQKGKKNLFGFFMGEVMKVSKGQADPKVAGKVLRDRLSQS